MPIVSATEAVADLQCKSHGSPRADISHSIKSAIPTVSRAVLVSPAPVLRSSTCIPVLRGQLTQDPTGAKPKSPYES